ncbi:MAG: hypothetical protein WAW11_00435 [Patescibacteria group bacterium]
MDVTKIEDLKVGSIYNREYIGPKDYKLRETFRIKSVDKSLVLRQLFSSHGSVCSPQLEGNPTTFTSPEYFFKDHRVWECDNPEQWFYGGIFITLEEALAESLVTIEKMAYKFRNQSKDYIKVSDIISFDGGCAVDFYTEPIDKYPDLKKVFIVFKNWKEMKAEVRRFYPSAWFMP